MPAGWVAAGTAVLGAATTVYGAKKTGEATEEAGRLVGEAGEATLERSQEAFAMGEAALTPYARQEQAASTQMMAQLGLAPPGGGGGGGGGDGWGFGAGVAGPDSMDRFLQDLMANETAISLRAGYKGKHGIRAVHEGARRAEQFLNQLKEAGQIPADYEIPQMQDLVGIGEEAMQAHGGYKALLRSNVAGGKTHGGEGDQGYTFEDVQALAGQYFDPGTGQSLDEMRLAEEAGAGGEVPGDQMGPGGPAPQTISDIMGRAGAEELPPEIREQYMQDLMGTEVGNEYQETGAYQAAREAGIETVEQGAAGRGGLYSGARGKALRDVGQDVEQRYYQMAQQQANIEASRRGGAYESEQQRGQSYYNNYMQMLSGMADPRTTTNIEQMRQASAQAEGATIMGTARDIGELEVGAAGAQQAAYADVASGAMKMGEAWIGSMN